MTFPRNHRAARWLLAAGLATGVATAYAATGFNVTTMQESNVKAGMSAEDVRAAIGGPQQIARYRNQAGPTWTYHVLGAQSVGGGETVLFDVDFGADGRVASIEERRIEGGGE